MITCPVCRHRAVVGALYCSECGAQLAQETKDPAETLLYPLEELPLLFGTLPPAQDDLVQENPVEVGLFLAGSSQLIPLDGREEFTLGRNSGDQPILPDLDLSPFEAYEAGVSRLHATLTIKDKIVWVTDLGSTNGTRVNGKKIPAHSPHPLEHEDIITLGNFKIQVLMKK